MTKTKRIQQQMKQVLHSPLHQSAIAVEKQVTRVPTVLKKTLIQETIGLLNVQHSICKQKRAGRRLRMMRVWNQMLLAQAITPVEHGVGCK